MILGQLTKGLQRHEPRANIHAKYHLSQNASRSESSETSTFATVGALHCLKSREKIAQNPKRSVRR